MMTAMMMIKTVSPPQRRLKASIKFHKQNHRQEAGDEDFSNTAQ
jgi:hypothetical protein